MRYLDKFLDSLACDFLIKNSQIFQDFLQLEEKDFNNKKKEYSKIKAPAKLSEMKTIEGNVKFS